MYLHGVGVSVRVACEEPCAQELTNGLTDFGGVPQI